MISLKKEKKKKETKKLTKKQIIGLIIITIILGIICYFISTEITKSIIDYNTLKKQEESEDFSDLIEADTISNITLNDLLNNYNDISNEDIKITDIKDNRIVIDDIEIIFDIDSDNVNIVSINFKKKNTNAKEIISNMIIASNPDITEDTTTLIYDKVFETLGNTTTDNSKTSEFFQYQGLEFSLKEYDDEEYKYSFRIGRIIEEEEETKEE